MLLAFASSISKYENIISWSIWDGKYYSKFRIVEEVNMENETCNEGGNQIRKLNHKHCNSSKKYTLWDKNYLGWQKDKTDYGMLKTITDNLKHFLIKPYHTVESRNWFWRIAFNFDLNVNWEIGYIFISPILFIDMFLINVTFIFSWTC